MTRVLPVLFVALLFTSCANCDRYTRNYVVDGSSHKPIPMVEVLSVAAVNGNQYEQKYHYTDSAGWFETTYSMSGMGKCPTLKLTLTKTGYETKRVVEPQIGDTIYMRPLP